MTITGGTRLAALIGTPVGHSLSPALLNAAAASAGVDLAFVAFDVSPSAVGAALDGVRAFGLAGLSVTMPHKEAVAALVDERSDDAALLGAVNCVVPVGRGLLRGENTDGGGFVDSLRADDVEPSGLRCAVLGAGGAARAVVLALARAGAAEVVVVNRTPERAEAAAALAGPVGRVGEERAVREADLVVNATPLGMGDDPAMPVDPSLLHAGQIVADLIYHPRRTPLLEAASAAGTLTVDGLGMLVHQAARAFELWTATVPDRQAMAVAAIAELRERAGQRGRGSLGTRSGRTD